ncbi:dITP/XTP pyrophosphatase [BD1-7 clade bacterium]|uniref:dITP/XTP pyrophosphatase n=1 Tax=BD1-7 clade bacterium TaxID=2029982 RepID=A0A5S9QI40_9GAMM|nr:dITP/XTP pyrophosphatase [BD1-7 clade bacterium]
MDKLVLASGNRGKLKEFQQIFAQRDIRVLPQAHFNIDDVEETGLTFVENAILKARHAAKISGLPALADDSGLEVDALRGKPGIYSARFSGPEATDQSNNDKLLKMLSQVPADNRTARFHCVLVLMRHAEDPTPMIFHGQWQGQILSQARGTQGFGYDPLFFANDQQACAAELPPEVKNQVSHRGQAVTKLIRALQLG